MPLSIAQSRRLVRSTCLAGVLLALAALLGVLLMAWRTRADAIDAAADRTRLLARVLEDQATRTVDAAALGLTTLADGMGSSPAREVERLDLMLRQLVAAQPSLRAAAVLDSQGRILASSTPRDVGQRVAINGWGPIPAAGTTALLRSQPGRGLTDANVQLRGDGLSFLPLVLPWIPPLGGEGAPLYLVAAINPDAIANYQQSTLEEHGQAAALFSYGGSCSLPRRPFRSRREAGRRTIGCSAPRCRRKIMESGEDRACSPAPSSLPIVFPAPGPWSLPWNSLSTPPWPPGGEACGGTPPPC